MKNNDKELFLKNLDTDNFSIYKKIAMMEINGDVEAAKKMRDDYMKAVLVTPNPRIFDFYVKKAKEIILKRQKQECSCKINKSKEKTIKEVFDEMTEEQKTVVYFLVGTALEDAKNEKTNNKRKN